MGTTSNGAATEKLEVRYVQMRSDGERGVRKHRSPSQKTMLSRALQKANTAVLLDNAQNYEGAMEAYSDACQLLQQVMNGSTGDEDKQKLEAIRRTYTNRINELETLDLDVRRAEGKALPERPLSHETLSPEPFPPYDGEEDAAVVETATATGIVASKYNIDVQPTRPLDVSQIPQRRQSLLPSAFRQGEDVDRHDSDRDSLQLGDWSECARRSESRDSSIMEPEYIPPPLAVSPRNIPSDDPQSQPPTTSDSETYSTIDAMKAQCGDTSTESTSWLDTIDESGGSSASSLHSRHSSSGTHQKHIHVPTDITEVELSAAMDAAVEAAYDDSFDIADDDIAEEDLEVDLALKARRNVELARQKVREIQQEESLRGQNRFQEEKMTGTSDDNLELDYLDEEAEEEERLLEEMTKEYAMDGFQFGIQSKSALPNQPNSSMAPGRTWGSSNSSHTATTAPAIAGSAEKTVQGTSYQKLPPPHPPPVGALPLPPPPMTAPPTTALPVPPSPSLLPPRPPSFISCPGPGVRDRRLSGQNAKQLKIETQPRPVTRSTAKKNLPTTTQVPPVDEDSVLSADSSQSRGSKSGPSALPPLPQTSQPPPLTPMASIHSGSSLHSESPGTPGLTRTVTQEGEEPLPSSPARIQGKSAMPTGFLRKNISSSSLKMRNLSVTTAEVSDISPNTPLSAGFFINADSRKGMMPSTPLMPTPSRDTFPINGMPVGGMYLFDDQICSPTTPSSADTSTTNAPLPLEPCPESFLLRPFWLMRCLYQTIAHPRGGYLSNRLFVPRDIWRVKNVKIKAVEEKVSHCDLLTAALLKLAKVDTLDADAVLEEMQVFENVLDHVRNSLQRKLGSEVGVQSSATLFKGSPATEDGGPQADTASSKSGSSSNKSYLSGWRKLRSKSSGAGLLNSYTTTTSSKEGSKDILSMSSLPMTSTPTTRPHKRNVSQVQLTGPNSHYMGALARLFDAAQILDQIARQVEDPGLKHSSKTHVGLELSTRNAAEFFGFYICRFALSDVGLMLDKFIKRGSEWVLA